MNNRPRPLTLDPYYERSMIWLKISKSFTLFSENSVQDYTWNENFKSRMVNQYKNRKTGVN